MALTFSKKLSTILYFIFHPKSIKMVLSLKESGYLAEMGWFRSLDTGKPVDKEGNPIPWFAYPATVFLSKRLQKNMVVFEYGSGNSTLFFAAFVKKIISVETNKDWYQQTKRILPNNAIIHYCDYSQDKIKYQTFIKSTNEKFDLIIVDADERNEIILNLKENLKDEGVIILDNSDREEYASSINYLIKLGFLKIDFWGITAGYFNQTCTTIFYKKNNCLGI